MKCWYSLLFFLISIVSKAQEAKNFIVYKVSGYSTYNRSGFNIPLKIGSVLSLNDIITLKRESSVTIICNNYNEFTINNKSKLKDSLVDLKKYGDSCIKFHSNAHRNFLKYISKHLHHETSIDLNDKRISSLNHVGSVSRGELCSDKYFSAIRDTIRIYTNQFAIKYPKIDTSVTYEFALFHSINPDIIIYKSPISNNKIILPDSVRVKMQADENYYWMILVNGFPINCEKKVISRISHSAYNNLLNNIKNADFALLSNSEKNSVLAFWLDKAGIVSEAYRFAKLANPKHTTGEFASALQNDLLLQFDFAFTVVR